MVSPKGCTSKKHLIIRMLNSGRAVRSGHNTMHSDFKKESKRKTIRIFLEIFVCPKFGLLQM